MDKHTNRSAGARIRRHSVGAGQVGPARAGHSRWIVLALLGVLARGALGGVGPYDDPRMVEWAERFLLGQHQEVLRLVEADLRRGRDAHPFAIDVWVRTHRALGTLEEAAAGASAWQPAGVDLSRSAAIAEAGFRDQDRRALSLMDPEVPIDLQDPSDLWSLAWSANSADQETQYLELSLALHRRVPDAFQPLLSLAELAQGVETLRGRVLGLASSGELPEESAKVLRALAEPRAPGPLARLEAVDAWLDRHPRDARALDYRASILTELERWEEAHDASMRSRAAHPFFWRTVWTEAAMSLRLGREDAAREVIARHAAVHFPGRPDQETRRVQWLAEAYRQAGDKGRARDLLLEGVADHPRDADLAGALAQLEHDGGRDRMALPHARRARELAPAEFGHRKRLVQVLRGAGLNEEAATEATAACRETEHAPLALFHEWGLALKDLGRPTEWVEVARSAADGHPESAWAARNLAQALWASGDAEGAVAAIERSLAIDVDSAWAIQRLHEYRSAYDSVERANERLRAMRNDHPWIQTPWKTLAAGKSGARAFEERLAIWDDAVAAAPEQAWTWKERADHLATLSGAAGLDALDRHARDYQASAAKGSPDARAAAARALGDVQVIAAGRGALDEERLETALRAYEESLALGSIESSICYQRSRLWLAARDRERAAAEALRAIQLDPDYHVVHVDLFTRLREEVPDEGALHAMERYLARDPLHPERIWFLVLAHIQWGGIPFRGLQLAERLREVDPDRYLRLASVRAQALRTFGAEAESFLARYSRASLIDESDRYVGWYESARLAAQRPSSHVDIDHRNGEVTITHPDGRVERRGFHPRSGRLTFIDIGGARQTFEYDEPGHQLRRIATSGGTWVAMDYDATGSISRMTTHDGTDLRFEYDAASHPVRIALEGVGEIRVEYDEDGEIAKVESPDDGHLLALQVTRAFQSMMAMVRRVEDPTAMWIDELDVDDPELTALEAAAEKRLEEYLREDESDVVPVLDARLAVGAWLVGHLRDRPANADRARAVLADIIYAVRFGSAAPDGEATAVVAAGLYQEAMNGSRAGGLSADDLEAWSAMETWLLEVATSGRPAARAAARVLEATASASRTLLAGAARLPRSFLSNPGYWRRFAPSEVSSIDGPGTEPRAILVRRNGDVVAGGGAGLHVLRRGYWERFGYDAKRGRFAPSPARVALDASSHVLALCEDARGVLWIGTAAGVFAIANDYAEPATAYSSLDSGLSTLHVDHLAASGDDVFVGTDRGLHRFDGERFRPVAEDVGEVLAMRALVEDDGASRVLVCARRGVYVVGPEAARRVLDLTVDDALWDRPAERLFVVQGSRVLVGRLGETGSATEPLPLPGMANVVFAQRIHGLSEIPLAEDERALAILTDQGVSICFPHGVEHLDPPALLSERRASVHALADDGRDIYLLSDQGVFAVERGRVHVDEEGAVFDLASDAAHGITYVARGSHIEWIDHRDPGAARRMFSSTRSERLALDGEGRLITHDGLEILRYAPGASRAEELFRAVQTGSGEYGQGPVRSILAHSDGTVWVAAGLAVFRWREGMAEAEEYGTFVDPERFPAWTHMVSRVLETADGGVWVVASNEGHLQHRGHKLSGGLMRWNGAGFDLVDVGPSGAWFLTAYTRIDDRTAIVGTSRGFARHRGGALETYRGLEDATYAGLFREDPSLFLGTAGARLGNDVWLFGCASGVVAYRGGVWFRPTRLNGLLPAPHLSRYGSRHIRAICADPEGRIYAGTDQGLLVYDPGGGDPTSFLIHNGGNELAFAAAEQDKIRAVADVLIEGLVRQEDRAEVGRTLRRLRDAQRELDALETAAEAAARPLAPSKEGRRTGELAEGESPEPSTDGGALREQLLERERAYRRLLGQLQRQHPGLHQLLEFKPLELAALRRAVPSGSLLVQYMPTKNRLFIHVVGEESSVAEVEVTQAELELRSQSAWLGVQGGRSLRPEAADDPAKAAQDAPRRARLAEDLAWLYDRMLRPIERQLDSADRAYLVMPLGSLRSVPMGALLRMPGPEPEYAVERYSFGYLPSMYLLDQMLRHVPSLAEDSLVFGDPDGSLAGARQEATEVHRLLGCATPLRLGAEATLENLLRDAESRVIHLATHAELDPDDPMRSYVLLAGAEGVHRLGLADISLLPLRETDLVVLSACETGKGARGIEYATLAWAFSLADVPSVVASLWRVDDEATRRLMVGFYEAWVDGRDCFQALAEAQRAMLKGPARFRDPALWAGFVPFGKP